MGLSSLTLLTQLTKLELRHHGGHDVPFYLEMESYHDLDVPSLSQMASLQELLVSNIRLRDVMALAPLAGLRQLTRLDVFGKAVPWDVQYGYRLNVAVDSWQQVRLRH